MNSKYSQEAEISFIYFPLQRVVYCGIWHDKYLLISFWKFHLDGTSWTSECVGLDSCTFIHLLTNLGDWGLEEPFHILLWSPPFQTEQSRFLFSRPILYLLASPFICVFADYSRPVSWAWLKYQSCCKVKPSPLPTFWNKDLIKKQKVKSTLWFGVYLKKSLWWSSFLAKEIPFEIWALLCRY